MLRLLQRGVVNQLMMIFVDRLKPDFSQRPLIVNCFIRLHSHYSLPCTTASFAFASAGLPNHQLVSRPWRAAVFLILNELPLSIYFEQNYKIHPWIDAIRHSFPPSCIGVPVYWWENVDESIKCV